MVLNLFHKIKLGWLNVLGNIIQQKWQDLISSSLLSLTQIGPVVSETSCRYKIPVTFPDTLLVGAKITDLQEDRFTMKYQVVSTKLNKVTTLGSATVVMFDFKNQTKARLSSEIYEAIQSIEHLS